MSVMGMHATIACQVSAMMVGEGVSYRGDVDDCMMCQSLQRRVCHMRVARVCVMTLDCIVA